MQNRSQTALWTTFFLKLLRSKLSSQLKLNQSMLTKNVRLVNHLFFTTPSKIPSIPKEPENCCWSTGPGSWNEIEKCPGGHRFCVCIWKIWEFLHTIFSPVVVTPFITTFPSGSTSQRKPSAVRKWQQGSVNVERWIIEDGNS
jgi:hypothetical protein